MGKISKLLVTGFLSVILLSGCAQPSFVSKMTSDKSYLEYEFRRGTKEEEEAGKFLGSETCSIYDEIDENLFALAYGQLRTLFGEPDYETEDLENMYDYNVVATDKEGNEYYMYAYSGPTGPAIGTREDDEKTEKAARALAEKIKSVEPTDYDYVGYYFDFGLTVKMGVKNGKPYCTESGGDGEF
ncbi:hypothetical protein [Butyrivibrio sp. WCD2001]|uniref:hypothetical protein n=1 Tax=Butyrivibrio sp. WCD2001 TaxID=1280681 RepID=UPI000677F88D|nr:hypothetical protein [Butyrivibrio sp. WCD2001]